jgi:DNA invertase Pin-like site-specific DNA recombinase/peptidoglycan hydrolase-like protein with peptidoglycan-binding domain
MLTLLPARCAGAAITLTVVTVWAMSAPVSSAQAAKPETSASTAVLAQGTGMRDRPSVRVRQLQRILERAGFDVGSPGVDGRFGPLTAAAVRRMQNAYGLAPDGIVGAKTRRVVALIGDRQLLQRQRARGRSKTARPRAPRASTTPQTAPPTTPQTAPPSTAPAQPKPGGATATRESAPAPPTATTVPIVLSAIAVLMAATALAMSLVRARRARDGTALAGVPRDLYLEGHSSDERVGTFRGHALAVAMPSGEPGGSPDERYLVDDPRKPNPVWVSRTDIRRSPSELRPGEPVLGYVTAVDHAGREHQQVIAIEKVCAQARLDLKEIIRDEARDRMADRPGLIRALEAIAAGDARGLVIGEGRRMVRSMAELGSLLEWFRDAEAALVAVDLDVDTSTAHGKQSASTLIAIADWERDRAGSRTRTSLASVKDPARTGPKRRYTTGDRAALVERINAMRQAGMSLQAIADQLNNEGVPALRGGAKWRPSALQAALASVPETTGREQLPPLGHRERDE